MLYNMAMFRKKRILVTGGSGFIGANLVFKLVNFGAEVNLLTTGETENWRLKEVLKKTKVYQTDFLDLSLLKRIVKKIEPEIIYHLASYGGHHFQDDPQKIIKTNILGTYNLLEAVSETDYQMFINTGSSSEYGFKREKMNEKDLLEPVSFYAISKAACSLMGQMYARKEKKRIMTFRPFSVYGPYDNKNKFIPKLIYSLIKKQKLQMSTRTSRHDYIYIDDVIDAYLKAPFIKKITGEIINLGTGKQYTLAEVITRAEKLTGEKLLREKRSDKAHSWDSDYWVADNSKAIKMLDWEPQYNLTEGLAKTIAWFRQNISFYET